MPGKGSRSNSRATNSRAASRLSKEDEEPDKSVPIIVAVEADPFTESLVRIWQLPFKEQRKEIGVLCNLPVEPLHFGPLNIKLDLAVGHLEFAKKSGFSLKQTKIFYELMQDVHRFVVICILCMRI